MSKKTYIKRLFNVLGEWKKHYMLAAILLVLATAVRMLGPKILQVAIDGVVLFFVEGKLPAGIEKDVIANWIYNLLPTIRMDNLGTILIVLGLIYLAIAALQAGFRVASSALSASSTEKAIKKLRDDIFLHIQRLPVGFIKANSTGEMIQRCTGDLDTVRRFILNQVVEIIRIGAVFVFAFTLMFLVNKSFAFVAIIISPFILITTYFFFNKEGEVWTEHEDEADKLTTIVNENLNGIRVVQAFANEDYEINKFTDQNKAKRAVGIKQMWLHAKFWPFSDSLVHLQVAISIVYGGWLTLDGVITVGELSAFLTYGILVTWPMQQLGRIISQMGMAVVAMERLALIVDADEEDYRGKTIDTGINGDIEFKNVTFSYPDSKNPVLENVSFVIKAEDQTALIGPTGSGKSTIIALLSRFYEPDSGEIFVDGIPLNQLSKSFIRDEIGIIMQKPFLFSTTIYNNIAYTDPNSTEDAVIDAAKDAGIHEIAHIFNDGYQTMVGEKGVTLSGGQKQRVALARALLKETGVLILDDATSAVDTATEFKIQKALQNRLKKKTVIVIAHRVTSIQHADKVIVFEKGKVIQSGAPKELLKQTGFYKSMLDLQTNIESEILN